MLAERDSDGIVKSSVYDRAGRIVQASDAGAVTVTAYDAAGRAESVTAPDGMRTLTTYDTFSRPVEERTESATGEHVKTTEIIYDAHSRVTTSRVEQGAARTVRETVTAYPASGLSFATLTISSGNTTTTLTYNSSSREETRVTDSAAGDLTWQAETYDAAGRLTAWNFRGAGSSRTFDSAGRVKTQSGEGFSGAASYTFDATTGRKSAERLPLSLGGTETATYTYTDTGRLSQATIGGATAAYAYETGSGNITGIRRGTEPTATLVYDSANRLLNVSASGSVVATFTWDTTTGRRVAEGPLTDPDEVTYAYDAAGRLARYTDASTQTDATYTYDADGQRTSSVVTQGSATTTSTYTYEGLTLLSLDAESEEGTAAASWRIDYLTDASGRPYGGIYTSSETSPVAFGIVTTDRGDVRELTDGTGEPFSRYDHDAYGNPTRTLSAATAELDAATAEAIAGRNVLRYAGCAFDDHSGLYYLSQRYYDPATCQFISKDPAKADGEESAYQYRGGDPVGKVDPSGEWCWVAYHYVTAREALARSAALVSQYVIGYAAQEFAASLLPTVRFPRLVRDVYRVYSGLDDASSVFRVISGFYKSGDLLILQRSTYAYFSQSCHSSNYWVMRYRYQVQRKESGRWIIKRTWEIGSARASVINPRTGRALVGSYYWLPTPRRVYRW